MRKPMTTKLKHPVTGALCLFLAWGTFTLAEGDDLLPGGTLKKRWIQDDIGAAYARAQATGKPLLVAFR